MFTIQIDFEFDASGFDEEWEQATRKDVFVEERVRVNREAVMVLQNLDDEQLGVLQLNRLDTIQVSATRGVHDEDDGLYTASTGEVFTDSEALEWGMKYNRPFAKRWIKDNRVGILEDLEVEDDPEAMLKVSRQLRMAYPFNNDLSKRMQSSAFGNSTYGKFMYGIRKWEVPGPYLVFGVAGDHHAMSAMDNVVAFVDINSVDRGPFKKGRLEDWRDFLTSEVVSVVSDCSYGDGEGLEIPSAFYRIYDEMAQEGFNVVFKANGLEKIECRDSYKYRMHNKEVICLAGEGEEVDVTAHILVGNLVRAHYLLWPGLNKPLPWSSQLTRCDVLRLKRYPPLNSEKEQMHGTSILDNIVCVANRHIGKWKELVFNEDVSLCAGGLQVAGDTPIILYDFFETHGDVERLFSSFFELFEMHFDSEFGWIALERK